MNPQPRLPGTAADVREIREGLARKLDMPLLGWEEHALGRVTLTANYYRTHGGRVVWMLFAPDPIRAMLIADHPVIHLDEARGKVFDYVTSVRKRAKEPTP